MLFHFFQIILRNIVHLGPLSRFADRQIVFGAVPPALGATASRFAATLVTLDEGTPQYGGQVGQTPQERFLSSPQCVGRFFRHACYPTSYRTGLILSKLFSLVNSFFSIIKGLYKIFYCLEAIEIQERRYRGITISLIGPLVRNRKGAHGSSLKEQGIDSRDSTGFKDRKTLAAQRVKGMGNLRPSQRTAAMMCI